MLPRRCWLYSLAILELGGCAASVGASDAGDAEVDGPRDAIADGGPVLPLITCPNPDAGATFDRALSACSRSGDCVAVIHGTDCCGSQQIVGINAAQQAAFGSPEHVCEAAINYHFCRCVGHVVAQDGNAVTDQAHTIVDCVGGVCLTHAP